METEGVVMRLSVIKAVFLKDLRRWWMCYLSVFAVSLLDLALTAYLARTNDEISPLPMFVLALGQGGLGIMCLIVVWLSVREDSPVRVTAHLRTRPVRASELLLAKALLPFTLLIVPNLITDSVLSVLIWGFRWDVFAIGYGLVVLKLLLCSVLFYECLIISCLMTDLPSGTLLRRAVQMLFAVALCSCFLFIAVAFETGWQSGWDDGLILSRNTAIALFLVVVFGALISDLYQDVGRWRLMRNLLLSLVVSFVIAIWWPYRFLASQTPPTLHDLAAQFRVIVDESSVRAKAVGSYGYDIEHASVDLRDEESQVALEWSERYEGLPVDVFVTPYSRHNTRFISGESPDVETLGFRIRDKRVSTNGVGMLSALQALIGERIVQPRTEIPSVSRVGLFPGSSYHELINSKLQYSSAPVYAAFRWRQTFALGLKVGLMSTEGLDQFRLVQISHNGTKRTIGIKTISLDYLRWTTSIRVNRWVLWDDWSRVGESHTMVREPHIPAPIHLLVDSTNQQAVMLSLDPAFSSVGRCSSIPFGFGRECFYEIEIPAEVVQEDGKVFSLTEQWLASAKLVRFDPQPIGYINAAIKDVTLQLPSPITAR